jgi:hypothetical protein
MKQKSSITYGLGVRGEDDEEQYQKKLARRLQRVASNTVDKLCTTIVLCPPAITNYEIKLNA